MYTWDVEARELWGYSGIHGKTFCVSESERMREEERARERGQPATGILSVTFPGSFSTHHMTLSQAVVEHAGTLLPLRLPAGDPSLGVLPLCVMYAVNERGIASLSSPSSGGGKGHLLTLSLCCMCLGDLSQVALQEGSKKTNACLLWKNKLLRSFHE